MPHFSVVAPIFPVAHIGASINYYVDQLLFKTGFKWSDTFDSDIRYAILINGDTELHITHSETKTKAAAYFFLKDVAEYYHQVKDRGAKITDELAMRSWGMLEFEVVDLDGNRLIFGEQMSGAD